MVAALDGERHPPRVSRVRGRGARLPRRDRDPARRSRPRSGSSARCSGSRRPTGSSRWGSRGSPPGRPAAGRARPTAPPDLGRPHGAQTAIELGAPAARRGDVPRLRRATDRRRVSDPARPGWARARAHRRSDPGRPDRRAAARGRLPALPAADPVRLRLLVADARLQGERCARSGCSRSGSCCSRRSSSASWRGSSWRGSGGRPRSPSEPSSRHPTRSRPRRCCVVSVSRDASSRSSRARASSTTRPR